MRRLLWSVLASALLATVCSCLFFGIMLGGWETLTRMTDKDRGSFQVCWGLFAVPLFLGFLLRARPPRED